MANIVPLLSTAFAIGGEDALLEDGEEPVESGAVEDELALIDAVAFAITVAMVVFDDCIVEETLIPVA